VAAVRNRNQLLAAIALCVATTILLKMHGAKYLWITCVPLAWLVAVTFTAAWQKIFSPIPAIGFLAQAGRLEASLRAGTAADVAATQTLIFNARLDAVLCGVFLVLVATILLDSMRVWMESCAAHTTPRVRSAVRAIATARGGVMKRLGRFILALLRELADESAYQRHLRHTARALGGEWRRFSEERLKLGTRAPSAAEGPGMPGPTPLFRDSEPVYLNLEQWLMRMP